MTATATNLPTLIENALDRSAEAAFTALNSLGGDRGDCGNAYVVVTARKGRKALVEALAAQNIRTDKHHRGGVAVHILRGLSAQSRLPYEKGADAFADTLRAAGIEAHVYSYAD